MSSPHVAVTVDGTARSASSSGADETTPLSPHHVRIATANNGTAPIEPPSDLELKIAAKLTPEEMVLFNSMAKRPDPDCPWPTWFSCIWKLLLCPLYGFHKVCSLRYYTSWSLLAYVIWFPCYFAIPFSNALVRGALWELAFFVAPASTAIFILSPSVPRIFAKLLGWTPLLIVHVVIHILPLILILSLTSVPHPPVMASTGLFAASGIAYVTILWLYFGAHPLTNYGVERTSYIATIIAWTICWIGSVITCELLFAYWKN